MNQEEHHLKKSFKEEFYDMLREFNIEINFFLNLMKKMNM
jgi:hypothetical protein